MKKKTNKFSVHFDPPDERDYQYTLSMPATVAAPLPSRVDLRSQCSVIENQEKIGSCTANALVGNMEFLELKTKSEFTDLSRLFVYYNERLADGDAEVDGGSSLRTGIKVLHNLGVCSEKVWPYNESFLFEKPNSTAYEIAFKNRIAKYERIKNIQEMKDCLASGYPFVCAFRVYESFQTQEVAMTGIGVLPDPSERLLGGHAVMAVGYDDSSETFLLRNSWGSQWGQKGYFTFPYEYLANPELAQDFWSIKK